jgi:hypothetical protein
MKNTLVSLTLLLSGVPLLAQTGLHMGFVAGGQYTMMLNDQPLDGVGKGFAYVPSFGGTGMFRVGINFLHQVGIHTGVAYAEQVQAYNTVDDFGVQTKTSRHASYFKIPLLLHLSSIPGSKMFIMEIGPQIGLLNRARIDVNDVQQQFPFGTELLWKATDLEIAWSLGAELAVSEYVRFVVQHRGDYGILDFEKKDFVSNGVPFYPVNRGKCNNLSLGLVGGMNFLIKGTRSKVTRHYKGRTWRNNWR